MSITISYDGPSHRLRLEGRAEPGDVDRVRDAIDAFGGDGARTIVDLIGCTHLDADTAEFVVSARDCALSGGRDVILIRRAHSQVDHAIVAAEAARTV